MIPFGEWLPDQAAYMNQGATDAKNVLALTNRSYGPLGALNPETNALTNTPLGAAGVRAQDGTVSTFVGDESDLFKLNGVSWDNVTKGAAGSYNTGTDNFWRFIQYGDNVICCNGHADNIQSYVLNSSSEFADLSATAPRAKHIQVINNFVMVGNTWDATDGERLNRVWWSAIDDPTNWPSIGSSAAATVQSDRQDLPTGGAVQNIIGAVGGADGAIFLEKAIYRVSYEGAPLVFSFVEVERDRGTPSPNSVVNVGPFAFYLGEDGFYSFNGTQSTPIGSQKVDKHFYTDVNQTFMNKIYGAADPINKVVFWSYVSTQSTNGQPDKLIMFNWETGRWSYAEIETEILFRDLTQSYTLEGLDALGTLDSLPYSLDSRIWTGGLLALSAFDTDNKLARFAGLPLAATITTTELGGMELFQKPNERLYIDGARPYVDGGTFTVSLQYRDSPTGSLSVDGPNTVDANGMAHFTRSCRYARLQVDIAAQSRWTHAMGVDLRAVEDGEF